MARAGSKSSSEDFARSIDPAQLLEIRARQRTFEGAYARTALANLGYALAILRLFDRHFYRIGLLYSAMAVFMLLCAFLRSRFTDHRHSDETTIELNAHQAEQLLHCPRAIRTKGHEKKKPIGPPFVTAGRVVVLVALVVFATEITLCVLIFEL
ncbi:hypothetical protein PENSPDRAFT_636734 [Peniophora sp. CONT]|nr:hypothetical protein PENSPDRAFT_636734 [Peniophora sp. CONT]